MKETVKVIRQSAQKWVEVGDEAIQIVLFTDEAEIETDNIEPEHLLSLHDSCEIDNWQMVTDNIVYCDHKFPEVIDWELREEYYKQLTFITSKGNFNYNFDYDTWEEML